MFTKRFLLLALTAALLSASIGCCWRRSACYDQKNYDPDCKYYYDPCK